MDVADELQAQYLEVIDHSYLYCMAVGRAWLADIRVFAIRQCTRTYAQERSILSLRDQRQRHSPRIGLFACKATMFWCSLF